MGNRLDTGRIEAFSDGVSAFAITLPVLASTFPSPGLDHERVVRSDSATRVILGQFAGWVPWSRISERPVSVTALVGSTARPAASG